MNKRRIFSLLTVGLVSLYSIGTSSFTYAKEIYYIEQQDVLTSKSANQGNNTIVTLIENKDYEEAVKLLLAEIDTNPNNDMALAELSWVYYQLEDYDKALFYIEKAIEIEPNDSKKYVSKVEILLELNKFEEAKKVCQKAIDLDSQESMAYFYYGYFLFEQDEYNNAIRYFDKAIECDKDFEDAYISKAYCLISSKQYTQCITLLEQIMHQYPDNKDTYWLLGDVYAYLYETEKAIDCYKKALEHYPDETTLLMNLGWEYYYIEDYDEADKILQKIYQVGFDESEKEYVLYFEKAIEERKLPLEDQIVNFARQNYLYINNFRKYETKAHYFKINETIDGKEIYEFIESVRIPEDRFTFVICGDEFENFSEKNEEDTIIYEKLEDALHYIKIDSFNYSTYEEFNNIMSQMNNTKETELIIDLRSNIGGLLTAANDISDILLPECEVSAISDRNGKMTSYYSSPDYFEFRKIHIFVDDYSASASELLAMSLKEHLNNVTVIGKPTFGKGVCQQVYENKKEKVVIFLVNSYWSVEGKNVLVAPIQPDIIVNSNDIEKYIDAIR